MERAEPFGSRDREHGQNGCERGTDLAATPGSSAGPNHCPRGHPSPPASHVQPRSIGRRAAVLLCARQMRESLSTLPRLLLPIFCALPVDSRCDSMRRYSVPMVSREKPCCSSTQERMNLSKDRRRCVERMPADVIDGQVSLGITGSTAEDRHWLSRASSLSILN